MPTPRSLLHLNGADGSTTVTNDVTGGSAIPWAFVNGGAITAAGPYLGAGMALLNRTQSLATTAAVVPTGDWTLAFRLGIVANSDNGRAMLASQGKDGDPGAWILQTGGSGDTDIYFYVPGGADISNELSSGQATAINNKLKAGNCFLVIQYMSGVMSVGFAGSGDTQVTRILNGAYPGGQTPQGILRFNTHVNSGGGLEPDTGTSRVDEVVFQDGGAIYPTYPFAKPAGEYSFAGNAYELIATPASVALTPAPANLARAAVLSATPRAVTLTRSSANLAVARVLSATPTAVAVSTVPSSLARAAVLSASPATVAVAPVDASLETTAVTPPTPAPGGGRITEFVVRSVSHQPLLQRIMEKRRAAMFKPRQRQAAKRAKAVEVEAAKAVLAGADETQFRGLLERWKDEAPVLPAAEVPSEAFMAQVAFRIQQMQDAERAVEAIRQARRQDDDAVLALLLA